MSVDACALMRADRSAILPYCLAIASSMQCLAGTSFSHPYGLVYVVWEAEGTNGMSWMDGAKKRKMAAAVSGNGMGDWRWMDDAGIGNVACSLGVPILQHGRRDDAAEGT